MSAKMCVNCVAEMHPMFCLWSVEGCKPSDTESPNGSSESTAVDDMGQDSEEKVFRDPISTGRKRAAVMYPISPGQVCDWAWRKQCGGGIEPIMGCTGRPATHIHHGPDKSTLNNVRENISLVCNFCHNRWHVANDKYYVEPRPSDNSEWLPTKFVGERHIFQLSDSIKASKTEILTNELLIPEGGKDGK